MGLPLNEFPCFSMLSVSKIGSFKFEKSARGVELILSTRSPMVQAHCGFRLPDNNPLGLKLMHRF